MNLEEAEKNRAQSDLAATCWFLTGATASGKSQVAMHLCEQLDAELISLDSMAIYRGMDIGTAKPSRQDRSLVEHHLIDIVDPDTSFSVSQYRDAAMEAIRDIRGRGKEVLFVGGTALYLKTLLRGMFNGPPADWEFRQQIETELANVENDLLLERLRDVDPVSAHKLHVNDRRRIVRALEVYRATGQPMSHWQMEFEQARSFEECKVFTLRHPRPELHRRIEERVAVMFKQGLVDEVRVLLESFASLSHTAAQAVGYQEVIAYLRNEMSEDTMLERTLIRTRKFARHQETWFRGLEECEIYDISETFDPAKIAKDLFEKGKSRLG